MKRLFATLALVCVSMTSYAADPAKGTAANPDQKMQDMMKLFQDAATPGQDHKMLTDMAGEWNYKSKMWDTAKAKPKEATGSSTITAILGGRFIQQNVKGEMMGQPWEGMGLTGFDNVTKKYNTVWMDTMSTGMMRGEGEFDKKAKVLKDSGTYSCPITEGHKRDYRTEMKMIDKNKMTFALFGKGLDGSPEFKMMEMTYTRK